MSIELWIWIVVGVVGFLVVLWSGWKQHMNEVSKEQVRIQDSEHKDIQLRELHEGVEKVISLQNAKGGPRITGMLTVRNVE